VVQSAARFKIFHISNHRCIVGALRGWLGISDFTDFHSERVVCQVEHIIMNQGAATDSLSIDSRTIGASQIPNQQTFRRPNQNAMELGNTFVIKF
jgi:hypothetical protein